MQPSNPSDHWFPVVTLFVEKKKMANWSMAPRKVDEHTLTFVYQGRVTYTIGDTNIALDPGDAIFIPAGTMKKASTGEHSPMSCYTLLFDCRDLHGRRIPLPFPTTIRAGVDKELLSLFGKINELWLDKKTGFSLGVDGLFMQILHRLMQQSGESGSGGSADPRMETVKTYILQHFAEKLDIGDLASLVHLNRHYFAVLFKKQAGVSIREYINLIRVRRAADLLAAGDANVTEAAEYCGYENVFYFSQVFKRIMEVPPSDYIRQK